MTPSGPLLPHLVHLSTRGLKGHRTEVGEVVHQCTVRVTGLVIETRIDYIQLLMDRSLSTCDLVKQLLHLRRSPRQIELRHISWVGHRGEEPHVDGLTSQVRVDLTVYVGSHSGISISLRGVLLYVLIEGCLYLTTNDTIDGINTLIELITILLGE